MIGGVPAKTRRESRLTLDELEFSYWLPELLPVVDILHGDVEGSLH